jgi:hypothetical protein
MNLLHTFSRLVGDDSPLWPLLTGCGLVCACLSSVFVVLWFFNVL